MTGQLGGPDSNLSKSERRWLILLGVAFFLAAGWSMLWPLNGITSELDGSGTVIRSTQGPRDYGQAPLLYGAVGLLMVYLGINGVRMTRVSIGTVSASSDEPGKRAEEYAKSRQPSTKVEVDAPDQPAEAETEPTRTSDQLVVIDSEEETVYSLNAVPLRVLGDLLANWPTDHAKPRDFSAFEFATRKTGRGNHPWLFKFRDLPGIRVSYGGQGKTEATVEQNG